MQDNQVCIIGMGYVGLTLAVAMAKKGYEVYGVEIDEDKLATLKSGKPHFHETGLESTMNSVMSKEYLSFTDKIPSYPFSTYIITVGTPLIKGTKTPRFDMIENVAKDISQIIASDSLVILRSTVAVGTTRKIVLPILQKDVDNPQLVFAPERTLEGRALEELFSLPQVVGAIDESSMNRACQLFHRITPTVIRVSSLETAETIKLFDNVYRDIQFAIGNEIAEVCETISIDGYEAVQAANLGYSRTNIAQAGYVGGACLSKDPHILAYSLREYKYHPKIMLEARSLHEKLQGRIASRVLEWAVKNKLSPKNIDVVLLGLAFKGNPPTDDLRDSPSIIMIKELRKRGFKSICGHDYLVGTRDIESLGIQAVSDIEAFTNTSVVIFMNNNPMYKSLNITGLIQGMAHPAYIMDSWNMFDRKDIENSDIEYGSIGRI